ncbi:MAG: gliding motility lipoprotein GldH [Bacteroidota bacterium]|nr:gliding motility lipoprotein GldH [Bacteroidota bacterium]
MKLKLNLLIVAFVLITCGCSNQDYYFEKYRSLPNYWHKDSIVRFDFEIQDTAATYNLFLNIRANNKYPFSNIYLITNLEDSTAVVKRDTLEYVMASPDGKMLGNGFSDIKESMLWYKENYKFNAKGNYTIHIEQALRKRNEVEGVERLDGVSEVGFSIQKIK